MHNLPQAQSGKSALEVAITTAKEAGEILLSHFGSKRQIRRKSKGNLVTDADIMSEKFILKFLQSEYPNFSILSEESNPSAPTTDYTWIVDPLDGTNNYTFGIPFFCVNIALAEDEDILLGITYDPVRKELFRAERGQGAYLNDSAVRVSTKDSLQTSLVGFDLGYSHERGEEMLNVANKLWGKVHCLRAMGSSSLGLAYVACGRVNLYFHRYLFPWDIASGLLLVREAGGEVTDWQGKPASFLATEIIASSDQLHHEFLAHFGQEQAPK
ncbi:MAG: inositol monophosphatase [Chloroflexi bacterium]|nr:inositol monophosphatase [Chloroflexota bacterium]